MNKEFILPDGTKVRASLRDMTKGFDASKKFSGVRLMANKSEFGFIVFNRVIYVFVKNEVFNLQNLKITNTLQNNKRLFRVMKESQVMVQEEYCAEEDYDINPFWPTEEEDVDNFLWFATVLNKHERRLVILEAYLEAEKMSA